MSRVRYQPSNLESSHPMDSSSAVTLEDILAKLNELSTGFKALEGRMTAVEDHYGIVPSLADYPRERPYLREKPDYSNLYRGYHLTARPTVDNPRARSDYLNWDHQRTNRPIDDCISRSSSGDRGLSLSDNQRPSQDLNIVETKKESPENPQVEVEKPDDLIEEEVYIADPKLAELYEEQEKERLKDVNENGSGTTTTSMSLENEVCLDIVDSDSCTQDTLTTAIPDSDQTHIEQPILSKITELIVSSTPMGLHKLNPAEFDPYQKFVEYQASPRIDPWLTNQTVVQQRRSYPCSNLNQGKVLTFDLSPFRSLMRNDSLEFKGKNRNPAVFSAKEFDKVHRSHHPGRSETLLIVSLVPTWLLNVKKISLKASSHHPQEPVDFILLL